ncbi:MAG: NfeD family protein [Burkholderiaceae bacterium]|nr:NfeD family protein [Burkholderiaceae bacterium]MCB1987478.1 NfeD family protein [Burkholderiaceae bacterium]
MEESTIWWLLAGGMVVAELITGTFYLLMVALGLAAAALVAHAHLPLTGQIVTAAVVGGGAVVTWHFAKRRRPGDPSARADRSVNLDVGETIVIDSWNADGTTTVKYRGATWTAIHRPGVTPSTGAHRVAELVGSRLLVDPL